MEGNFVHLDFGISPSSMNDIYYGRNGSNPNYFTMIKHSKLTPFNWFDYAGLSGMGRRWHDFQGEQLYSSGYRDKYWDIGTSSFVENKMMLNSKSMSNIVFYPLADYMRDQIDISDKSQESLHYSYDWTEQGSQIANITIDKISKLGYTKLKNQPYANPMQRNIVHIKSGIMTFRQMSNIINEDEYGGDISLGNGFTHQSGVTISEEKIRDYHNTGNTIIATSGIKGFNLHNRIKDFRILRLTRYTQEAFVGNLVMRGGNVLDNSYGEGYYQSQNEASSNNSHRHHHPIGFWDENFGQGRLYNEKEGLGPFFQAH